MRRSSEPKRPMWRLIGAMVAGILAWMVVASLLNVLLRLALPGYAAAEPDKSFTLAMLVARLVMGAVATLAGGAAAGWIDRPAGPSVWVIAAALLTAFIPAHIGLWNVFPAWYHITFLLSLVPLTVLGSLLGHKRVQWGSESGAQQAAAGEVSDQR
jgi:hypothetical protein